MQRREVVTCFLQRRGHILALKRSHKVRTHRGKWAAVSGGIETANPLAQAYQKIVEETGIPRHQVRLVREGEPLDVPDTENDMLWHVRPFLFGLAEETPVRLALTGVLR